METENETVYITEKNIYRMRIKNLESTFGAYNFWLAEDTEKQQTLLESYMIQLSNGRIQLSRKMHYAENSMYKTPKT